MTDPVLRDIAAAHGKSLVQVILRWDLQRGVTVIPGSSNPKHIRENISIFDFELSENEMGKIAALSRNEQHDWYCKYNIVKHETGPATSGNSRCGGVCL